jgi:hypothetical protein
MSNEMNSSGFPINHCDVSQSNKQIKMFQSITELLHSLVSLINIWKIHQSILFTTVFQETLHFIQSEEQQTM